SVQHLPDRRAAAGADRQPGHRVAARGGGARTDPLPVLRLAKRRDAHLFAELFGARERRESPSAQEGFEVSAAPEPRDFYCERIPTQFNRALDAQAALGEPGRRVYDGMRAVSATIRVDVEGEGGGTFYL